MSRAAAGGATRHVAPFAALSAAYFAHIGFFNPYLPLWLKELGLPIGVISLLASVQSFTRVFAPYVWGMVSDHTGERVRLLRYSALVACLTSVGFWWHGGPAWIGLVLLLVFTHTSSMMGLTEAAMAQVVDGDWGRYGRIRLWGSAGFMVTVFIAGAWFDHFGMGHFPGWTLVTLAAVFACTLWLPNLRDPRHADASAGEPIAPVLSRPVVRWFFASLLFHVMAHFAIYAYFSLFLDARGYGKAAIGAFWAISVVVEIAWFFWQGRVIARWSMARWLLVCGLAAIVRMAVTGSLVDWWWALALAQLLHALTFAAHHTACIAMVTHHFPGRLRGRGQALFTVVGYGVGGVVGVLAGGSIVAAWGYPALFGVAASLAAAGTFSAWQVQRLDRNG